MLIARRLLVLPVIALALGFLVTPHAAEAATKRPSVTARVSAGSVALGSSVKIIGTVSGRSAGATVRLQHLTGGAWRSVESTKVKKNRTYRFSVTVRRASNAFRTKVVKNKRLKAATSRTVRVSAPSTSNAAVDAVRNQILAQTNAFRAANGRAPLALMPGLNAVAQDWSVHMAATGTFEHRPSFASGYPSGWTGAAENIAAGQAADQVVDAWIKSDGHRKNLLGDYNYLGIGYATGGPYGRYYTQNFAKYPGR